MTAFAGEIAGGSQLQPLDICPPGELGVLAAALNDMLESLQESRQKILEYTDNLENMVLLRTRALRESEEKYRTMVENVPIVVYRLLGSGKMVFINHFIEDLMGVTASQAQAAEDFWRQKVWVEDRDRVWPLMDRCLLEGCEFNAEYRIQHATGKLIFVQGHALPILDEYGQVETVDGFLVNVTDRYRLQQQIIQTEELRTLSEVSARLAHEIRNPLVAAGGFARRLLHTMPEGDPNREKVQIIVQEVARLEKILEKTLGYLRPFELALERLSLSDLVAVVVEQNESLIRGFSVEPVLHLSTQIPALQLDRELFRSGLESLLRAVLEYCLPGGRLELRTYLEENAAHLEINANVVQLSEDDIQHFFYPFTTGMEPSKSLDLSLAKMIIHKHGGLVQLRQLDSHHLTLKVTLPL
jgi:PAS domain S-box-containing protein